MKYIEVEMESYRCCSWTKAPVHYHGGKLYAEGVKGEKWRLRIFNFSRGRILVVPTVDGLSVMDGKEGSWKSSGYILSSWGDVIIPGFRLDDSNVAAFKFGSKYNSYASQMGKPSNVGVIGVAVFEEKPQPPPEIHIHHYYPTPQSPPTPIPYHPQSGPYWINYCASPCRGGGGGGTMSCCNLAARSDEPAQVFGSPGLGTEFGERQHHQVYTEEFERATASPVEVVELLYDDRDSLIYRGVIQVGADPRPFPAGTGCTPPPGWRG